jgi:hypothetical protein
MPNNQQAARLREMANNMDGIGLPDGYVTRTKPALLAGAEALEAVEVAKAALGDIANVGNSYCNEHDNVDCITCIHETCVEALARLEGNHG